MTDVHQARLSELLVSPLSNGRSVPTADSGFPVLRSSAVRGGRLDLTQQKVGRWSEAEARGVIAAPGDVFIVRGSGSLKQVGQAAAAENIVHSVAYPDTLIRARLRPEVNDNRYFVMAWNSPVLRRQLEAMARTTAGIYKLNQKDLHTVLMPVPGLPHQRRILTVLEDHLSRLDAADAYPCGG